MNGTRKYAARPKRRSGRLAPRDLLPVLLLLPCLAWSPAWAGPESVSPGPAETEAVAAAALRPFPVIFEARHRATLSASRSGVLGSMKVDVGSRIKKGALIASVDSGEPALRRKRGELAVRHLNKKVAELTKLNKSGLATNDAVQTAIMERDLARSEIAIYRREIAVSAIKAPFACEVIRRHAQAHEWVTEGQPVVDVVSLAEIRAVANIPSHIAVRLKPEMTHEFYVNDLDVEVTGTVAAITAEVDERSNTVRVVWKVAADGHRLLPGMKGEVRLDG
ncbi:MAG: hypothetical protein CSB33_00585 [Desulfobacterales bacterium]|nr:MAG: hypothetical protein CSB33_00585 [Desulfobacterales bacterium]